VVPGRAAAEDRLTMPEPLEALIRRGSVQMLFGVLLLLMGWVGWTLTDLTRQVAAQSVRISILEGRVVQLTGRIDNLRWEGRR